MSSREEKDFIVPPNLGRRRVRITEAEHFLEAKTEKIAVLLIHSIRREINGHSLVDEEEEEEIFYRATRSIIKLHNSQP